MQLRTVSPEGGGLHINVCINVHNVLDVCKKRGFSKELDLKGLY